MSEPDDDVLRERARRIAAPLRRERIGAAADVLVARVATELYGIGLHHLAAVLPVQGLTPVPCTPATIAGVMNVRGDILTVLRLRAALELPPHEQADEARVVLAELTLGRVGLLVDAVVGVETVDLEGLEAPQTQRDFVRGSVGGRVTILDLERLLTDERVAVRDEVA